MQCRITFIVERRIKMNTEVLEGKWKQMKGRIQEQWGDFTDDEVDQIQGRRDMLIGKLQEKYGYTREQAERELDVFLSNIRV
jgi:uncharacterized protein YjbJ (UPF0337 family)